MNDDDVDDQPLDNEDDGGLFGDVDFDDEFDDVTDGGLSPRRRKSGGGGARQFAEVS